MTTHPRAALTLLLATLVAAPFLLGACAPTTRRTLDDATISTRVKTALLNDPEVGALRIDVNTFSGVVTLSGTVRSPADMDKAAALARRINGVADVKMQLQIQ